MRPPGTANWSDVFSANKELIVVIIGEHWYIPLLLILIIPGLISIFCPTYIIPLFIVPPATPPILFLLLKFYFIF